MQEGTNAKWSMFNRTYLVRTLLSIYLAQQLFKQSSNFNDRVTIFRRVRNIAKRGF